jgi:23S rRNA (guanine1835-N2)-methyltransferase
MTAAAPGSVLVCSYGEFNLQRYPSRRQEALLPWCAADSLLLEACAAEGEAGANTLVVNDEHGALATALLPAASWTDSALAAIALARNLERNQRPAVPVIWSVDPPPGCPLTLIRVPKHLPYFEYQLALLAQAVPAGARILAAGMDKHLSPRTAELLETVIGPTTRHRGQRKARLFSATRDPARQRAVPAPMTYYCEELGATLQALANVFSADHADIGSRFLLSQLHRLAPAQRTIDLACGNGIIGLAALDAGLTRELLYCDESAMALHSARLNTGQLYPQHLARCEYHHGDGLLGYHGPEAELVLCNPPFHQQHVVDDHIGRRLLRQVKGALGPGGRLCLVANRHLNYGPTLRRQFRRTGVMASNRKFNLWLCES